MKSLPILFLMILILNSCSYSQNKPNTTMNDSLKKTNPIYSNVDSAPVKMSEEEWKKHLTPEQYRVSRQKGTERPWTSIYEKSTDIGTFYCAACGNPLFKSDAKFESGCGWPSFYEPISTTSIKKNVDNSHGMIRTEVVCGRCDGHLGHVFDDGPPPPGLRFCINGVVLDFEKANAAEKNYENKK